MTENIERSLSAKLPIKLNLNIVYVSTIIQVVIMLGISIAGILFQSKLYPDKELSVGFVSLDIYNLIAGIPIIIISMLLTKRGKLIGLLCYPGALLYITYVYLTNLLGLPFNVLFIPYLILATLSIYTIIVLIASIDSEQVRQKLKGYVPIRTAGAILFAIACLLIINLTYEVVIALINQSKVDQLDIAHWIADFVVGIPSVIIIGFSMIRGKALGYTLGISLLLFLSVIFFGVVPVLIVKGIITNNPIEVIGIVVVLASSMICFIPLLFFIRGINKAIIKRLI